MQLIQDEGKPSVSISERLLGNLQNCLLSEVYYLSSTDSWKTSTGVAMDSYFDLQILKPKRSNF